MDSALVTAIAAGLGSMAGASATIVTTFLTQRAQSIRANAEWQLRVRESFIRGIRHGSVAPVCRCTRPFAGPARTTRGTLRDSESHSTCGRGRRSQERGHLLPADCRGFSPAEL